jgi:peptidoglycan/xylan/chitin deacetylase (PgdA/CDA1 family)
VKNCRRTAGCSFTSSCHVPITNHRLPDSVQRQNDLLRSRPHSSMTRFAFTTLLAITAALAALWFLHGSARFWGLIALGTIYVAIFALGMSRIGLQFFCPSICRGEPGPKRIALTFDDGPDPAATPALLDLLRREGVIATFFCIGRNVEAHPALAARLVAEGHLLGNHLFSHGWWTGFLRKRGLVSEIIRTQQAIQRATGSTPTFVRPPVGLTNPHFAGALKSTGLTMIGWDLRTFDSSSSAAAVIRRISRGARDGSIIVLHDGGANPANLEEILTNVIPHLRSEGFTFARVDEMLPSSASILGVSGEESSIKL